MIEHCITVFQKRAEEKMYRMYVTDALKAITENTARRETTTILSKRFVELISETEPEKTGDEIAEEVIKRAGLTFG